MKTDGIAVIDDNRQWVDAVAETLLEEGYRIHTAFTGDEAADLLNHTSPQLVILDMHMPGVSGLRLLADFRRRDAMTPVLVMSSEDRASMHDQAMANSANGFLRKPCPPAVLLSAVRRYAGRTVASVS